MDFAQDSERLLTFTGDGSTSLQIFEVSASLLNVNNDKVWISGFVTFQRTLPS